MLRHVTALLNTVICDTLHTCAASAQSELPRSLGGMRKKQRWEDELLEAAESLCRFIIISRKGYRERLKVHKD